MSLAEKWEEFARNLAAQYLNSGLTSDCITFLSFQQSVQRAFYAGAEAYGLEYWETEATQRDLDSEIDRFKGQK